MIRRRAIRLVVRSRMLRYMIGLIKMSWLVGRVEPYEASYVLRNLSDFNVYSTSRLSCLACCFAIKYKLRIITTLVLNDFRSSVSLHCLLLTE